MIKIHEEDGIYVSKSLETGIASCGDTKEEAIKNLREAMMLYLDNARELGLIDLLK